MYIYLGDRLTGEFKGRTCTAVRRPDGKCIRGKNGSMLVEFDGVRAVVLGRRLRKVKPVKWYVNVELLLSKGVTIEAATPEEADRVAIELANEIGWDTELDFDSITTGTRFRVTVPQGDPLPDAGEQPAP